MVENLTNFIFPLLGIAVIIISVISMTLPSLRERMKEKSQKIKGLGIDLEVSSITLLLLVGFVLTFVGVYLQVKDYEGQVEQAKSEALRNKLEAAQALARQLVISVELEGVDNFNQMPKMENLECRYLQWGAADPVTLDVMKGIRGVDFRVVLKDVTHETTIQRLDLVDRATNRTWYFEKLTPLQLKYVLKRGG